MEVEIVKLVGQLAEDEAGLEDILAQLKESVTTPVRDSDAVDASGQSPGILELQQRALETERRISITRRKLALLGVAIRNPKSESSVGEANATPFAALRTAVRVQTPGAAFGSPVDAAGVASDDAGSTVGGAPLRMQTPFGPAAAQLQAAAPEGRSKGLESARGGQGAAAEERTPSFAPVEELGKVTPEACEQQQLPQHNQGRPPASGQGSERSALVASQELQLRPGGAAGWAWQRGGGASTESPARAHVATAASPGASGGTRAQQLAVLTWDGPGEDKVSPQSAARGAAGRGGRPVTPPSRRGDAAPYRFELRGRDGSPPAPAQREGAADSEEELPPQPVYPWHLDPKWSPNASLDSPSPDPSPAQRGRGEPRSAARGSAWRSQDARVGPNSRYWNQVEAPLFEEAAEFWAAGGNPAGALKRFPDAQFLRHLDAGRDHIARYEVKDLQQLMGAMAMDGDLKLVGLQPFDPITAAADAWGWSKPRVWRSTSGAQPGQCR